MPLLADTAPQQTAQANRRGGMVFYAFAAILALAPLPLGAARPLAWDVLALLVALLLLASLPLAAALHERQRALIGPALLLLAVGLFVLVQIADWTPASWQNPLWDEARESLQRKLAGSIAVDRQAALVHLLRILSYAGCFYLAFLFAIDARRAAAILTIVGISGGVYAGYGLIAYWAGNHYLLWMPKWAYPDDLTGPFVNRNSFATYLGLCAVALVCRLLHGFKDLHLFGGWRTRLASLIEFLSGRAWLIAGLFLVATALFLTHSRGGFLSMLAGLATLAAAAAMAPSLRGLKPLRWIALLTVLVALAFLVSGGPAISRVLGTNIDGEERLAVYRQVLNAIGDYPLFGTGFGSFSSIFPIYRTPDILNLYDLAHNDYLENLLELGIPAALCLFAALAWLTVLCIRGVRLRRRDAIFSCAGVAASALVAVNSAVDFSLQIPAVTVTYMAILGIAVAQCESSRAHGATTLNAERQGPSRTRPAVPGPS